MYPVIFRPSESPPSPVLPTLASLGRCLLISLFGNGVIAGEYSDALTQLSSSADFRSPLLPVRITVERVSFFDLYIPNVLSHETRKL